MRNVFQKSNIMYFVTGILFFIEIQTIINSFESGIRLMFLVGYNEAILDATIDSF